MGPMYGMPPGPGMPPHMMYGGPPPGMYGGPPYDPRGHGMPPTGPSMPVASYVSTLWIGKIAPGINDDVVRRLLVAVSRSGTPDPINWRRQLGKNNAPLQFGFADFRHLEDACSALRILNGFKLGDRELQLKADEKNQKILDDFAAKKKASATMAAKPPEPVMEEYSPDEGTANMPESNVAKDIEDRLEQEQRESDRAGLEALKPIQVRFRISLRFLQRNSFFSVAFWKVFV